MVDENGHDGKKFDLWICCWSCHRHDRDRSKEQGKTKTNKKENNNYRIETKENAKLMQSHASYTLLS